MLGIDTATGCYYHPCMTRAILVLLFLVGCGGQRWTTTDTVMQATFAATMAVDYWQTTRITADNMESNPVIGSHGQNLNPVLYFATATAMQYMLARILPKAPRRVMTALLTGNQIDVISFNARHGYGM